MWQGNIVRVGATAAAAVLLSAVAVSSGGNCLFGNGAADVEATSLPVVAGQNWWGQPGGPQPGQTATAGTGTISSSGGLSAKPSCGI